MNYDPGYLYPGLPLAELYTPPDALVWRPAAGATWVPDGGEATVDLDHLDETRSHLTIARLDGADGHIAMQWLSSDGPDIPVFYRIALPMGRRSRRDRLLRDHTAPAVGVGRTWWQRCLHLV